MVTMYDTITVDTVPANAEAVAGYVGGSWPTYNGLVQAFPHAHHLSIAVFASENAEALDVEAGDASPWQAGEWARRQIARGVHRPVLYSSVANMGPVIGSLTAAGLRREEYRLWTAHYTYRPHLCPSCGFTFGSYADATQYDDKALGRNLDASLCSDSFFSGSPLPPPPPEGVTEDMLAAVTHKDGQIEVFAIRPSDGQVFHTWQQRGSSDWVGAQAGKRTAAWYPLGPPIGK